MRFSFGINGYFVDDVNFVFGSIAKELNVRLAMGSLLAICFVIIGCTPAVLRGDSLCVLCLMGCTPAILVFGAVRALSCEVLVVL